MQADHYIVSSNGAIFNHPDDEAVSRTVAHGGDKPPLWFNFDNERNRRWAESALRDEYGHHVELPDKPDAGITVALGTVKPPMAPHPPHP